MCSSDLFLPRRTWPCDLHFFAARFPRVLASSARSGLSVRFVLSLCKPEPPLGGACWTMGLPWGVGGGGRTRAIRAVTGFALLLGGVRALLPCGSLSFLVAVVWRRVTWARRGVGRRAAD